MKVLVRAYGSHLMGMGHLYRVEKLVKKLKEKINCEIVLLTKEFEEAIPIYQKISVDEILELNKNLIEEKEIDFLKEFLKNNNFDVLINDQLSTSLDIAKILTQSVKKSITFDDKGEGNYFFDYIINVLYPTRKDLPNEINDFKYLILNDHIKIKEKYEFKDKIKKIFINQGAADTWGAIPDMINDLNKLEEDFAIKVLLGPAYRHFDELANALKNNKKKIEIYNYVDNVVEFAKDCDLAILGAGNTLFEIASIGMPIIASTREKKELITINRLLKENIVFGEGKLYEKGLDKIIKQVINNTKERKEKYKRNKETFTYSGIENIINLILKG